MTASFDPSDVKTKSGRILRASVSIAGRGGRPWPTDFFLRVA